jgi:hypothetical protein
MVDTEKLNASVRDFHSIISKILKICKKIEPGNLELESLHSRIALARDISPLFIIDRCKDKVWAHREHIISEDEAFFTAANRFDQYVKQDENKPFMDALIDLIQSKFRALSVSEKKAIWKLTKDMLASIIEYKKATFEFN